MTERVTTIAVVGAAFAVLAQRLCGSGRRIMLVVPDPDDRARIGDMLPPTEGLRLAQDKPMADLCLGDPALGAETSVVWTAPQRPAAVFSWSSAGWVVEVLGGAVPEALKDLVAALNGTLIQLPEYAIPPSKRLRAAVATEVERLLLTGASPVEIDDALAAEGLPHLVKRMDADGNDRILRDRDAVFQRLGSPAPLPLLARAVEEGRWGHSTGVGWYRYPGGGGPVEDPLVEDLAAEEAHFAKWPQQDLTASEIVERLRRAKDDAVADILDSGEVARRDVDVVLHVALGWG